MKTSLSRLLPLLLVLLLVLSGCGNIVTTLAEELSVRSLAKLPEDATETYPDLLQTIEQSDQAESSALNVIDTAGDGTYLAVLYRLTVPDDWEQLIGSGSFRITFDASCLPAGGELGMEAMEEYGVTDISNLPQRYDPRGHNIYFLSTFCFPETYTGKELAFQVENLKYIDNNGVPSTLPDVLQVSWTATNTAPHQVAETESGTCDLSPLRLTLSVAADAEGKDTETFLEEEVLPSLAIHCRDSSPNTDSAESYTAPDAEWTDDGVRFSAAPAEGSLFPVEDAESVEILGTVFSFETP